MADEGPKKPSPLENPPPPGQPTTPKKPSPLENPPPPKNPSPLKGNSTPDKPPTSDDPAPPKPVRRPLRDPRQKRKPLFVKDAKNIPPTESSHPPQNPAQSEIPTLAQNISPPENLPAPENTPVPENLPAPENPPIQEKTPIPENIPTQENAPYPRLARRSPVVKNQRPASLQGRSQAPKAFESETTQGQDQEQDKVSGFFMDVLPEEDSPMIKSIDNNPRRRAAEEEDGSAELKTQGPKAWTINLTNLDKNQGVRKGAPANAADPTQPEDPTKKVKLDPWTRKNLIKMKAFNEAKEKKNDPKFGDEPAKPKAKAPKMSISKARLHVIEHGEGGENFATEEKKIDRWVEAFVRKFDHVKLIEPISKKVTFEKHVTTIKGRLAGEWSDQVEGLKMIRALAIEISYEPRDPNNLEKMFLLLRDVNPKLEELLSHERTQLTTETCVTVAFLCREYRNKLEMHYLKLVISNLLHKMHVASLVQYIGKATLKLIFTYAHVPVLYLHLMKELELAKGLKIKTTIAFVMLTVMEYWTTEEFKPCIDAFEQGFKNAYASEIPAHAPLRIAFWIFNRDYPEKAKNLYKSLKEPEQDLLDQVKFLPSKQKPQEELIPPVVRERPLLLSEFEESEEEKPSPEQSTAGEIQPQLPLAVKPKKDKKKKKKKKKRSSSSSSTSSSDSSDSSSSHDDSSSSSEKKRRKKRRKQRRKKELKKLEDKLKKRGKPVFDSSDMLCFDDVDTFEDLTSQSTKPKKINFLVSLKKIPSKLSMLFSKSKTCETPDSGRSDLTLDGEKLKRPKPRGLPENVPSVAAFSIAEAELRSKRKELAKLKERLKRSKEELEYAKREAAESEIRLRHLDRMSKSAESQKRSHSNPELLGDSSLQDEAAGLDMMMSKPTESQKMDRDSKLN